MVEYAVASLQNGFLSAWDYLLTFKGKTETKDNSKWIFIYEIICEHALNSQQLRHFKMDFILGFFLWISILFQILWCLESLDVCTDRDVKLALQSCDPILSEISTFILQTPSNGSYSEACR